MSGTIKHFLDSQLPADISARSTLQLKDYGGSPLPATPEGGPRRLVPRALAILSIVAVSVITYLPAVDNFFISDDFTLLFLLRVLERVPMYIIEATSEMFRVVTYIYFWTCLKLFGTKPEMYYWAGIGLHAAVSLLVYRLVNKITGQVMAGLAAALFFAAYERHQEAIMWISAGNELVLTLNCLFFLLVWERILSQSRCEALPMMAAAGLFGLSLLSKEAAMALAPLIVARAILLGYPPREALRKSWVILVMAGVFGVFWLSQANRNFFVTQGHYALSLQFVPVYFRTLFRLISQVFPFLAGFLIIKSRSDKWNGSFSALLKNRSFHFFGALLLLAVVPYSFLTYLDHIPSRNTYFPSVGLAGVNGVLFAATYAALGSVGARRLSVLFLGVVVAGNSAYIWLKKDPQYVERSAPTRTLIDTLNLSELRVNHRRPFNVCGFTLHPWIGETAVTGFTSFTKEEVLFSTNCDAPAAGTVLIWDKEKSSYTIR